MSAYLGGINDTGGIQESGSSLTPGAKRILMSLAVVVILGAIVVGALFATGVIKLNKESQPQSCEDEKNCKAGQKCGDVNGNKQCVTTCESNANCNAGLQCYNGICSVIKDECSKDTDCPEAQACSAEKKCVPVTCSTTGCDAGFECVNDGCQPIPNETCLQGKECPADRPVCQPSDANPDTGVCVPAPQPECNSDECTKKGPKFFCNAFNVCVETADTPTVNPTAARDITTGLSTAQWVFVVLAGFAALFCAIEFYRIGRRTYRARGRGLSPRQRERNSGEIIAAVVALLAVIMTFLIIGFDANDNFLIIPGIFLAAAVGLLVYFLFEERRLPYTVEEVQVKGAELQEASYDALKKDLDILDAIAADPDIPDTVKQDMLEQIGINLAYSTPYQNAKDTFEDNLEKVKGLVVSIVETVKLRDDLEDNDMELNKFREALTFSVQKGYETGGADYIEDLNYRKADTEDARETISRIKERQKEIKLWGDNATAKELRKKMVRIVKEIDKAKTDPNKADLVSSLRTQYYAASQARDRSLRTQREQRDAILTGYDKEINKLEKKSLKRPTLDSTKEIKKRDKQRRAAFKTLSGSKDSERDLDRQKRILKKELKKTEGKEARIKIQEQLFNIKRQQKENREIKSLGKQSKRRREKRLKKKRMEGKMKSAENLSYQEDQARKRREQLKEQRDAASFRQLFP